MGTRRYDGGIHLMKTKIEHPKIFLSYAWGTEEYQNRVLSLAGELQSDGIEVLLDKWDLKEGHDTYAYMEQSVNDPDVTNVLLLLDPLYAKKADERAGGVGTETQIISPEIYNKVTQEKFLPVVMERDDDGTIPKPHYLKGLLHFDLSVEEKYDDEYQRLVKRLYGVEVYIKPELGNVPKWVTEETPLSNRKRTALQTLKKNNNPRVARAEFIELLNDLKNRIVLFNSQISDSVQLYDEMLPYREEYLQIVKAYYVTDDANVLIGDFLQEMFDEINDFEIEQKDIKQVFLHEIFIYTAVIFFKSKDYESLAYILNRSFLGKKYGSGTQTTGFRIFYHNSQQMDFAKCRKDDKNYLSGTAQNWIDNIASDYCNKKEFAFIDVLLCNYALFGANYGDDWPWFPITYIYDVEYNTILKNIAGQMKSKEVARRWSKVFGFDDVNKFCDNMRNVLEKMTTERNMRPRYNRTFSYAQLITDFITPDEIGTLK